MGVAGAGAVFRSSQAPVHPHHPGRSQRAAGDGSSSPCARDPWAPGFGQAEWAACGNPGCDMFCMNWHCNHYLERRTDLQTQKHKEKLYRGQLIITKRKISNIWDKIQNLQDTELPKALYVRQEIRELGAKMHYKYTYGLGTLTRHLRKNTDLNDFWVSFNSS